MAQSLEKATESKKGFVKEFVNFLQTFGIIGLAIAFIIGAAASALMSALVNDLINPLIGLVLPGVLATVSYQTTSLSGKSLTFGYGHFISQVINFLIVALVVFAMYKQLKKMGLVKL